MGGESEGEPQGGGRKGAEAMKSPNKVLFYGVDPAGYSSLSL